MPITVVTNGLAYPPLAEVANVVVLGGPWRKFEYEVLALDITPYDITFKTDADILFPSGAQLYHPEHLPFTSGVACDVLGRETDCTAYREIEVSAGLPTVYSAVFSFDKRQAEAQDFFAHLKYLFDHWYGLRIWDFTERKLLPTTDTAYSLAHLFVMGATRVDGNQFVHCKPYINAWTTEQWTTQKAFTVDKRLNMHIDGVKLRQPFHYFDKTLINDSFIQRLEHVCSL